MKKFLLLLVGIMLTSCSTDTIAQEEIVNQPPVQVKQIHTFTVVWSSNQENPYVEFNKHIFKNCEVISTESETHRENKFDITLEDSQLFDIHIKRTAPVKNAQLYLAIYKGDELQFEQEINTNGYVLASFVDNAGNIGGYDKPEY